MKFIRKSIARKAIFLSLILGGIFVGFYLYFKLTGRAELPLLWLLVGALSLIIIALLIFLWDVLIPLSRLTTQVTNLLTGKTYQRVTPKTIDEIGIMTHFFNEITQDLEKISYDVKERRRMSSELDIAANIQRDVLPKEVPQTPALDIVAKTRSAAEVGGDIFDFLESQDKTQLFIYIGDVTGHGVPSGLIMMMVETLVTAMVDRGINNTQELVTHTNNLLQPRISSRLFMTSVMLRWDKQKRQLFYTGAGHEHILVYRHKTESVQAITSGGIALGMVPDVSQIAKENQIPLEVGDCVVLYTDGITEAKNQAGEMYSLDRLARSLKKNGFKPSAESIFDGMTNDFSAFVREYVQTDDITMMVIKYTGDESTENKVKLTISKDQASAELKNRNWNWS